MIEWKDKIEQKKSNEEKITLDGKYELRISDSPNKYFFISSDLQTLMLGYGHGETELEAIKDCYKHIEPTLKHINAVAAELKAIIIEMEKAEHPMMTYEPVVEASTGNQDDSEFRRLNNEEIASCGLPATKTT